MNNILWCISSVINVADFLGKAMPLRLATNEICATLPKLAIDSFLSRACNVTA